MALHFVQEELQTAATGDIVELTGPEARHAASVRRVKAGEDVTIGNGRGLWATGAVALASSTLVRIEITAVQHVPRPRTRLTLVQALAKGDRDELAVQTATELGIDAIVPWQAERSVSRWVGPKAAKGVARWQSIVREAAKQAHRAWIPIVTDPVAIDGLEQLASEQRMLILDPWTDSLITALEPDERDITLVVGPEGGIAPSERARLEAAGAECVRLGDTVLRTSTAGPAAISVLSAKLGRW